LLFPSLLSSLLTLSLNPNDSRGPQTDFIVLPCDFVPPPTLQLSTLLDAHRIRDNAALTALFYERAEVGKDGPDRILVGYDKSSETLLHVHELEKKDMEDEIALRMSMLWK
jgi:translation initiation factor eIF-2B subunit gamma